MSTTPPPATAPRLYGVGCALVPVLAALLIHPVLEQGISDDWSYTRSAQVLADTGHIVYNGWATAMLGWQLYLGAAFVRLFGFSFTVVRMATLPVACGTAWLTQRSFVRGGLKERLAAFGALTLVLSPLFVPLACTYMSDLYGLFVVVLCFYCCLRVLAARTVTAQAAWLLFAIAGNAVGGTVRQIAWLGVLVMIPGLLWLRRRQRVLLAVGIAPLLAAWAFIWAALHWFEAQPYAIREHLLPPYLDSHNLEVFQLSMQGVALELPALLLPVLAGFLVPALRHGRARAGAVVGGSIVVMVALALWLRRRHLMWYLMAPTLTNDITRFGVLDVSPLHGPQPEVLSIPLRLAITFLAVAASASALWVALRTPTRHAPPPPANAREIRWLTMPFCAAYFVLLLPRAATITVFDRYLLPLLFFAILGGLRLYQDRVGGRIPIAGSIVLALFSVFSIAATHDFFSQYRARQTAIHQLLAAGVPPDQIAAGIEFNGWNEILRTGFVANGWLPGDPPWQPPLASDRCAPPMGYLSPHLDRHFALASEPWSCDGPAVFPPVAYRTWLVPRQRSVYAVRDHGRFDGR